MTTNIKITELGDIGNDIAFNSIIPVVDMVGTFITKKANLQIVGNLILSGAGGSSFVPAATAILSQSVTNAAQPNITSVGTLTSLNVTGNIGGDVIIANLFSGNGSSLSAIAGANVSGFVPNANIANTALSVAAANVSDLGNIATINLTGSTSNVLYGNGVFAPVSGGSANTGNVTFDDATVQGVNQLNLSAGPDYTANLAYLQVRAGDVASHIHFDTGNSEAYDLIVGNDAKFVQVSSTGNILMSSYDGGTSYVWNMDNTGNLNLPTNGNVNVNGGDIFQTINQNLNIVVQDEEDDGWAIRNTITDGIGNNLALTELDTNNFRIYTDLAAGGYEWRFNRDTLQVTTDSFIRGFDSNVTVQSMFAGTAGTASLQSVSNINDPNIFTTIDATTSGANIKVYNGGSNGGVGYTWSFGNDGNLTLPGNALAINFANGSAVFGNIVTWTTAPASNTSAGNPGQAAYDSGGNLYVCIATDTWSKFLGTTSW